MTDKEPIPTVEENGVVKPNQEIVVYTPEDVYQFLAEQLDPKEEKPEVKIISRERFYAATLEMVNYLDQEILDLQLKRQSMISTLNSAFQYEQLGFRITYSAEKDGSMQFQAEEKGDAGFVGIKEDQEEVKKTQADRAASWIAYLNKRKERKQNG